MSDVLKRLREGVSSGSLTLTSNECEEFWQILRQFERDRNDLLLATRKIEEFKHACNKAVVNGVPLLRVNAELKSLVAEADTSLLNMENKDV